VNERPENVRHALTPLAWTIIAIFYIAILTPPHPVEPLSRGVAALLQVQGGASSYRSAASRLPRYAFVNADPCAPEATIDFVSLDIPHAVGPIAAVPRADRDSFLSITCSNFEARAPPA